MEKGAPLLAPILALLGMLVVFRESISVSFPPDPHPVPYAFGIGRLELGAQVRRTWGETVEVARRRVQDGHPVIWFEAELPRKEAEDGPVLAECRQGSL